MAKNLMVGDTFIAHSVDRESVLTNNEGFIDSHFAAPPNHV
jgi:hypothetical protein